jgi:hypothetical protein
VLTVVNPEEPAPAGVSEPAVSGGSLIDEIVRDGARRMLAAALEAAYLAAHASELDDNGRRLAVAKLCLLVMVGVRVDGCKELIALRWRAVNAPHLVALVRAGAVFAGGQLVKRPAHAA